MSVSIPLTEGVVGWYSAIEVRLVYSLQFCWWVGVVEFRV